MKKLAISLSELGACIPKAFLLFTLDESVLSQCEREHPNDAIARLVCNNRIDFERMQQEKRKNNVAQEIRAQDCVDAATKNLIGRRDFFWDLMNEYADGPISELQLSLNAAGYKTLSKDVENNPSPERLSLLIFSKKIDCPTSKHIIFEASLDKNSRVQRMSSWIQNTDNEYDSLYLRELVWLRSEHLEDIALAEIRKQEDKILKQAQEKLKQEQDKKDRILKDKQIAEELEEQSRVLRLIGTYTLLICALAASIYLAFFKYRERLFRRFARRDENTQTDLFKETTPRFIDQDPQSTEIEAAANFDSSTIESELVRIKKFREENSFVRIDIPVPYMNRFISECEWYKQKRGSYPNFEEQQVILHEVMKK